MCFFCGFICMALFIVGCRILPSPMVVPQTNSGEVSPGVWSNFQCDPAHTGSIEATLLPPLEISWVVKGGGKVISSPAVAGDVIYWATLGRFIYATNRFTGETIWRNRYAGIITGSPVVQDNIVYIGIQTPENTFYALDAATGEHLWGVEMPDVQSSAAIGGSRVVTGDEHGLVSCFTTQTGDLKWTFQADDAIRAPVVIDRDLVCVGSLDNRLYVLNLADGMLRWSYETEGSIYSAPAVTDSLIYISSYDKTVRALARQNGELRWRVDLGDRIFSTPTVFDEALYVGCNDGAVYAFNRFTGMLLWSFQTGGIITSSPAVTATHLFIGSYDHHLYVLDRQRGELMDSITLGGPIEASPVIIQNRLYLGCDDQKLYAFSSQMPED